jgi:hypothetical protein
MLCTNQLNFVMRNNIIQQEILLLANTTLSKRQLCALNALDNKPGRSFLDQLEEICWNGLLYELLPDIMEHAASGKELYLWHICQRHSLLQIELSEYPAPIEKNASILSFFFLPSIIYN